MLIFYQCYVIILTLKLYQSILSILITTPLLLSMLIYLRSVYALMLIYIYSLHIQSIYIHFIGVFLYILTFNVYIWPFSYKINEYYNGIIIQNRFRVGGVYLYCPMLKSKRKRLLRALKGVFLGRTF